MYVYISRERERLINYNRKPNYRDTKSHVFQDAIFQPSNLLEILF